MANMEKLFEEAKKVIAAAPCKPTITYFQRQLNIGFNTASELVDILVFEKILERDPLKPWVLRAVGAEEKPHVCRVNINYSLSHCRCGKKAI